MIFALLVLELDSDGDGGKAAPLPVLGTSPRCLESRQWARSGQKNGANQHLVTVCLRDALGEKLQWPKMTKMNVTLPTWPPLPLSISFAHYTPTHYLGNSTAPAPPVNNPSTNPIFFTIQPYLVHAKRIWLDEQAVHLCLAEFVVCCEMLTKVVAPLKATLDGPAAVWKRALPRHRCEVAC
jgi:hypothetical protein